MTGPYEYETTVCLSVTGGRRAAYPLRIRYSLTGEGTVYAADGLDMTVVMCGMEHPVDPVMHDLLIDHISLDALARHADGRPPLSQPAHAAE